VDADAIGAQGEHVIFNGLFGGKQYEPDFATGMAPAIEGVAKVTRLMNLCTCWHICSQIISFYT